MAKRQKFTSIIPARPEYYTLWFYLLPEGVAAADATVANVRYGKDPIIAWVVTATHDDDGNPLPTQFVVPVSPDGDETVSSVILRPDGMVTIPMERTCSIEEAKAWWLENERHDEARIARFAQGLGEQT